MLKLNTTSKYSKKKESAANQYLKKGGFLDKQLGQAKAATKLSIKDSKRSMKEAKSAYKLGLKETGLLKKSAKAQLKFREKEIAFALGITEDRFKMNADVLGKTLESAAKSTELAIQNIELQKAGNDMKAYAARMLPPMFSADPEAPFAVPDAKFVDPIIPPNPVKMSQGGNKSKSRSTLGTILGIGGAVLGVAGAVFTGGASLAATGAATGFWGGGAAAGLGTALGAAGGGLGTIGSYL